MFLEFLEFAKRYTVNITFYFLGINDRRLNFDDCVFLLGVNFSTI